MRRCCEWGVYMRSANPDPESFVTPGCWSVAPGPGGATDDGEPEPSTWTDGSVPRPASTPTRTGSASERDGPDSHDTPDTPG